MSDSLGPQSQALGVIIFQSFLHNSQQNCIFYVFQLKTANYFLSIFGQKSDFITILGINRRFQPKCIIFEGHFRAQSPSRYGNNVRNRFYTENYPQQLEFGQKLTFPKKIAKFFDFFYKKTLFSYKKSIFCCKMPKFKSLGGNFWRRIGCAHYFPCQDESRGLKRLFLRSFPATTFTAQKYFRKCRNFPDKNNRSLIVQPIRLNDKQGFSCVQPHVIFQ